MRTHRAQIVFYGGALAMLSLIIFRGVDAMLPTHLATLIAQNSEALAYAPLIALAADVLRHRRLPVIAAVVALELAAGVALAASIGHIDSRIATLNEGVLAAAVVTAYVSLRRPLRWAGAAAAARCWSRSSPIAPPSSPSRPRPWPSSPSPRWPSTSVTGAAWTPAHRIAPACAASPGRLC